MKKLVKMRESGAMGGCVDEGCCPCWLAVKTLASAFLCAGQNACKLRGCGLPPLLRSSATRPSLAWAETRYPAPAAPAVPRRRASHALARSTLQNTTVYQTLPDWNAQGRHKQGRGCKRRPIILFVHVFKAAGSSVRGIFRRYAEKCNKRWACLVQCQKGGAPRGATVPCRLRDMVNLNRRLVMGEDGRRNPRTENLGALSHIVGGHSLRHKP